MSRSNHLLPVSQAIDKARRMRDGGLGAIHSGTVAHLLKGSAARVNEKCRRIARILTKEGLRRWSAVSVTRAHELDGLPEADLIKLDPDPPKEVPLPPQFAEFQAKAQELFRKTQSAPSR